MACNHGHSHEPAEELEHVATCPAWRARLYQIALSLPLIGGAAHAVWHMVAPIFGMPCP
jgi:hypothetical protein